MTPVSTTAVGLKGQFSKTVIYVSEDGERGCEFFNSILARFNSGARQAIQRIMLQKYKHSNQRSNSRNTAGLY
jgi:DNA-binding cell septation regulator SpoVG